MYCTECGAKIADDAKYCQQCGKPIAAAVMTNPPEQTTSPASGEPTPSPFWLYLLGTLTIGTYAAMLIVGFAGKGVYSQSGLASMLWSSLFFYFLWKRRARRAWQGALIGAVIGIVIFLMAVLISVYMRAAMA
jgi:zinc-ribbon domain